MQGGERNAGDAHRVSLLLADCLLSFRYDGNFRWVLSLFRVVVGYRLLLTIGGMFHLHGTVIGAITLFAPRSCDKPLAAVAGHHECLLYNWVM